MTSDISVSIKYVICRGAPVDRDGAREEGQAELLRDVAWCIVVLEGHDELVGRVLCYSVVVPPL